MSKNLNNSIGGIVYTQLTPKEIPRSNAENWYVPITHSIQNSDASSNFIAEVSPESIYDETSTIIQSPTVSSVQHIYKTSDINLGNMQDFIDEAARRGVRLRITSGLRLGATTSSGNPSKHASGNAVDITPIPGQTFEQLMTQIEQSGLKKWMDENGIKIYDETSSEVLAKTKGTAPHFHIYKDGRLSAKRGGLLPNLKTIKNILNEYR